MGLFRWCHDSAHEVSRRMVDEACSVAILQEATVTHVITERDDFIEVRYAGQVGFAERAQVMRAVAELGARLATPRVLSDFTDATVYEENPGARADFMASVITAPWADGSRVALVNLAEGAAKPARHASAVQGPVVRTFSNREEALSWLLEKRAG